MDYDSVIPKLCPGYERALAEFSARTRGAGSVLELGIGTGNIAGAILEQNKNAKYYGIDVDETMLIAARKKLVNYHCDLRCEDFSKSTLAGVDIIVSSLSIHHLTHPEQADLLQRIHGASKRFLHFELIAPENVQQAAEYRAFLDHYAAAQARSLGFEPELILSLQKQSEEKDQPLKLSVHKKILSDLGAKMEIVFQEYCFVFYQSEA